MTDHGTRETRHHNVCRVLTAVTRLASAEQHQPWRGDDGVGHVNDGLPGRTLRLRRDRSLLLSLTRRRFVRIVTVSVTPEVRQDCHSDNVLLGNVLFVRCVERRMVGVCNISILDLLQNANDLVEARVNFHYFDVQSWLP